jgi:hypothetical protein
MAFDISLRNPGSGFNIVLSSVSGYGNKVNGIAATSIEKVNGILMTDISKINGVA